VLAAALPSWRYLIKNDREEELIFRGGQIADAIQRYQKKNGNASPPNLETLVRTRHLRKLYKDPMTKSGKWQLLGPGQGVPPTGGVPPTTLPSGSPPTTLPSASGTGNVIGPIAGVASTSKEKGLRVFNGRTRYNEWQFIAGQPRVIGKQIAPVPQPMPGGSSSPGSQPSPPSGTQDK
jgi:type II secretory pathway pseudopilin PulG